MMPGNTSLLLQLPELCCAAAQCFLTSWLWWSFLCVLPAACVNLSGPCWSHPAEWYQEDTGHIVVFHHCIWWISNMTELISKSKLWMILFAHISSNANFDKLIIFFIENPTAWTFSLQLVYGLLARFHQPYSCSSFCKSAVFWPNFHKEK